jgi:hypothetical protein
VADVDAVVAWVRAYETAAGRPLNALLVDAYDASEYGGTGKRADVAVFKTLVERLPHLPIWLAGGLAPDNVAAAIVDAQPAGVDTGQRRRAVAGREGQRTPAAVHRRRPGRGRGPDGRPIKQPPADWAEPTIGTRLASTSPSGASD